VLKKIGYKSWIIFFLLLGFLPYLYLSFFAQPIADDFAFAAQYKNNNYFSLVKETYFNSSGRYISNFLIYLNPISFNSFFGYQLIPFVLIITSIVSFYTFFKTVFVALTKQMIWIITLSFSLIYISLLPNIAEQIYWFTGSIIYHLGLLITIIYFTFLIKLFRNELVISKAIHLIILSLLLLMAAGFNEVLTLSLLLILFVLVILFYRNKWKSKNVIVIQFLLLLVFITVLVIAPGNILRESYYPNKHQFFHSLTYSLAQTVRFSIKWILSPTLFIASILFIGLYDKKIKNITLFKESFFLNKWASLLILFSTIFVCVFPPYWATGILGQHRTVNVAFFFFLIIWFVNLSVWLNSFSINMEGFKLLKQKRIFIVLFLFSIFFFGNGWYSITDIFTGRAVNYKRQLDLRHQALFDFQMNKKTELTLNPIKFKPKCLFVLEISEDPNYWTNQSYNVYFKLNNKEVFIKKKGQE